MVESLAAGRLSKDSLGGVALPLMGVVDSLLESADAVTGITLLVLAVTASVTGVADSLELTADMMGVANVLELTGDAADMTALLMGMTTMLELDVGVATLAMGVVVVATNKDATLVLVGIVDVVTAELLIGRISVLLQVGGAAVAVKEVGGAEVTTAYVGNVVVATVEVGGAVVAEVYVKRATLLVESTVVT